MGAGTYTVPAVSRDKRKNGAYPSSEEILKGRAGGAPDRCEWSSSAAVRQFIERRRPSATARVRCSAEAVVVRAPE
jgi:hypothetical protein